MERAAGRDAATEQPDTLDGLRFHWGSAYDIGRAGGVFTAMRGDGRGDPLADPLPEGLFRRIRADYEAVPVPRSTP